LVIFCKAFDVKQSLSSNVNFICI